MEPKVVKRTSRASRVGSYLPSVTSETPSNAKLRPRTTRDQEAKKVGETSYRTPMRASQQLLHHQSTTSIGDGIHRQSSVLESGDLVNHDESTSNAKQAKN